jgi:hypothetical protein
MKWRIGETGVRVILFMLSMAAVLSMAMPSSAHEVRPAIADITVTTDSVELVILLPIEPLVAGMSLDALADTNDSPLAERHDRLRALSPADLAPAFRKAWPEISAAIRLNAGETPLAAEITGLDIPPVGNVDLPRDATLTLRAALPADGTPVSLTWGRGLGLLALRQTGDAEAYAALLAPGETSAALPRVGTVDQGFLETFSAYIVLGIEHIVPKGLDHILFVLGLFFFSLHLRPMLWQVTSFTLAHTLTLALASLGLVSVPVRIVEPLIALSIAYVAAENVFGARLGWRRIAVVFGFGLLHGLGFASVLGDVGLSATRFVTGLIGFNIGVELGQLIVIAAALLLVGLPFGNRPWYRARVALPASILIGATGLYWTVERVIG